MAERRGPHPCPQCDGPSSVTIYSHVNGIVESRHVSTCQTCQEANGRRKEAFRVELDHHLPSLTVRTRNTLVRNYQEFDTIEDLLAASDEKILGIAMIGHGALAEIREFFPKPIIAERHVSILVTEPRVLCYEARSLVGG